MDQQSQWATGSESQGSQQTGRAGKNICLQLLAPLQWRSPPPRLQSSRGLLPSKAAIHQGSPSLFPRKLPIAKTRTQKIPFPVNKREDASWGRGESLPPQPLRTKGRLLSPQFFPPTHRAVSLGRPLTHLLNSKAGATGRVRHTSQALLAGTVLTFLTGTNGVCI